MVEQDNLIAPARTPGWIRVLIHGLFVSAFKRGTDGKPVLEVGALIDPSPGHAKSLQIWNRDSSQEPPPLPINNNSIVHLEINNPVGVSRYQQAREFQWSELDDRYDFRWLVDFENHLYRGKPCGKRRMGFRFDVNEGVVFTLLRSLPLRLRTDGGSPLRWRRIAQVIAIDIEHQPGRTANLRIEGGDTIPLSPLSRFNIVLRNDCRFANCPGMGGGRSDFTELFGMVIKPNGESDFEVFKDPDIPSSIGELLMDDEVRKLGSIFDPPEKQLLGLWDVFQPSSPFDDADSKIDPCGMGFFGVSGGLGA